MADLNYQTQVEAARLKHYATKMRAEDPSLPKDATDDEIVRARYAVNREASPDLTTDSYLDGLDEEYGKDFTAPAPPSFLNQLGGQIAGAVKQIVIHPADTAKGLAPYVPAAIAGIAGVSAVPAQLGLAAHFGVKMVGAAIAGHKLEKTLADLPALSPEKINEIDLMLQSKGTDIERRKVLISHYITNVMAGYDATAQSLAEDVGQTATEGRAAGAELGGAQLAHLAGVAGAKVPGGPILKGATGATAGGAAFMGGQSAIEGRSPRQIALDALTGGALALPLGAAAGTLQGLKAAKTAPVKAPPPGPVTPPVAKPAIVKPAEFQERPLGPTPETAQKAAGGMEAAIREYPTKPTAPFKPTSRADQVPEFKKVVKRIEKSPEYKALLNTSGGGRQVTNIETWKKAIEAPPMTEAELSSWKPGAPVHEVDIARGRILRQVTLEAHKAAMESLDPLKIEETTRQLIAVESGFNNLTATPGRALQMQAAEMPTEEGIAETVQFNKAYVDKVAELQKLKIPAEQWQEQLDAVKKQFKVAEKKAGPYRVAIEHVETWATAAKLMSPMTHAINTISNTMTHILQRGPEKVIAAGILKATGHGPEGEAMFRNALWSSSQGAADATRIATREFVHRLKGEMPETLPKFVMKDMSKAEVKGVKLPLRADKVFSALDAADSYWKALIYHAEMNQWALTQALSEKLPEAEKAARVKMLMENAPETQQRKAWATAKEYTFQEDADGFLRALTGVQRTPGGRVWFAAFLKTPYNIIKFAVRRSPLGLSRLLDPKSRLRTKLAGTPVERAEALAQIGWGTALTVGMTGMVFGMETTAAYPKDPKERKRWDEQRITPWSIKAGNRWYNYSRFGPLSISIMLAAGYKQTLLEGKGNDAKQFAYRLAGQYIQGPLQLPMVQSTSSLLDALQDPENKLDKYFQTIGTGFVPNLLRDVRQQLDDKRRKPAGLVEALKDMLPGLSQTVEPRIDALGHESKLEPNRLLRTTKLTVVSTSSDVTKALDETGYQPPVPNASLTIHGKKVTLVGEEKTRFLKEVGKAAEDAIKSMIERPTYQRMSPKQKLVALTKFVKRRQEQARERFKRSVGKPVAATPAAPPAEGTAQKLFADLGAMGGQVDEATRTKIEAELIHDEGVKLAPYRDSLGNWTVGIGHLITSPDEMKKVTRAEADTMFKRDIAEAQARLTKFVDPTVLRSTGGARKRALVNLSFNLGNRLGQFNHFLDAVNTEDWEGAADLLKGTDYAAQVGDRATRIQRMLRTGEE